MPRTDLGSVQKQNPASGRNFNTGPPAIRGPTNPKPEVRNPKQIQNPKAPRLKTARGCLVLRFGFRSFGFVSDFEFRISGFGQDHDPSAEHWVDQGYEF